MPINNYKLLCAKARKNGAEGKWDHYEATQAAKANRKLIKKLKREKKLAAKTAMPNPAYLPTLAEIGYDGPITRLPTTTKGRRFSRPRPLSGKATDKTQFMNLKGRRKKGRRTKPMAIQIIELTKEADQKLGENVHAVILRSGV